MPKAPVHRSSHTSPAVAPDSIPPGTRRTGERAPSGSDTRLRLAFQVDPPDDGNRTEDVRLQELADFHRTGRPSAVVPPGRDGRLPALLLPVLELSALRTTWPAFLTKEKERPVRSLTGIMDGLIDSVEGEGDDTERLRRDLLKIERTIRQTVTDGADASFSSLWDGAVDLLFGGTNGRDDRIKERRDAIAALKPLARSSDPVLTCSDASLEHLVAAMHAGIRASLTEAVRADTDTLRTELERILEVDDSHAPEKKDSEHLEASMGAGDIDADALSGLLSSVPLDTRLPEKRRSRIKNALHILTELAPHVVGDRTHGSVPHELPERDVARTVPEAVRLSVRNERELVDFFRAFHTARLESENRFREDEHDDLLDLYSVVDLTTDELRYVAPVFLVTEDTASTEPAALLDLLSGDRPVIVLRLRRRFGASEVTPVPHVSSSRSVQAVTPVRVNALADRLAVAAVSAGSAFVMQTAASDLDGLVRGLSRGLGFAGPVLLEIYTGSPDIAPELPAYLRAAAALDARIVPSFRYDPAAGDDLASRFTVEGNPDPENDWPSSRLPLENDDVPDALGKQTAELPDDQRSDASDVAFTAVDVFACDDRFDAHFTRIPEDVRHEYLTTVADAIDGGDRIPFILLAGPDGRVHRYAVTRFLMDAAASIRDGWRTLREMGGVRNSHVRRQLDAETARIAAEKKSEIDELIARHERELDRATKAVAETIVSNVASKLLGLASARPAPETAGTLHSADAERFSPELTPPADPASSSPISSKPARSEDPGAEATGEAAPVDDETGTAGDAPLLVEDAYIDTPLCTSCNECTNLNGRIFAYDENKQAYIRDASAGPFRDIVVAAEKCPVRIIHPGKPLDPDEPGLDDLVHRADAFN